VWAPVEQRLRAAALGQREANDALLAAGGEGRRPQVLLLNDVPVYARDQSGAEAAAPPRHAETPAPAAVRRTG
jgi:hypothetical protein